MVMDEYDLPSKADQLNRAQVVDKPMATTEVPLRNIQTQHLKTGTGLMTSKVTVRRRLVILTGLCFLISLFYLFTYNSGYGYDGLEYLVIARAISRGAQLYSFMPSKSPGVYFFWRFCSPWDCRALTLASPP